MDAILKQKIANPSMELYDPHNGSLSPTSQLIDAIIDLITTEDYSQQVGGVSALAIRPFGTHNYSAVHVLYLYIFCMLRKCHLYHRIIIHNYI